MPTRLRVLAAIALLTAFAAREGRAQQRVDVRRVAVQDPSVRISGTFRSLRIVGSKVDSVVVTGTIPNDARFENFSGGKGEDPLRGAKMYLEVPNDQSAPTAVLELRVPERARVCAKAGNATIEVTGVVGGLDLNIVGGSIRVSSSPRELNIESMDGTVVIEGSPAWLRAKTAAGDITMRGSSEDAGFTTVSGTIRVGEGSFERARFESVTGGLEFSGDPVRAGALVFDSHSGQIEIRLDAKAGAEIEATSIAGTIENQLTRTRPTPGRDGRGQELSTSTGSDLSRLTIRTFKGTVKLSRR